MGKYKHERVLRSEEDIKIIKKHQDNRVWEDVEGFNNEEWDILSCPKNVNETKYLLFDRYNWEIVCAVPDYVEGNRVQSLIDALDKIDAECRKNCAPNDATANKYGLAAQCLRNYREQCKRETDKVFAERTENGVVKLYDGFHFVGNADGNNIKSFEFEFDKVVHIINYVDGLIVNFVNDMRTTVNIDNERVAKAFRAWYEEWLTLR